MELLKIFIDGKGIFNISISIWIILLGIAAIVIWIGYAKFIKHGFAKNLEIDKTELGIGKQKVTIKPNYEDIQIAYKLWVELSTRKIGLPIDFENDVIIEIYNSWYEFFRLTRDLIKTIPVTKIKKYDSTREIVNMAIDILNMALRPHLTTWQAKYRRWYYNQMENKEVKNLTPQELQKGFPEYYDLIENMKEVNKNLIHYREILKKLYLDG